MNGLLSRWMWRNGSPCDSDGDGVLGESLVSRVLAARGFVDAEAATSFLQPRLLQLHDPSLIPDLDRAAARILSAADAQEGIAIYGDYDVDGVTATAILYHVIRHLRPAAKVTTYVPHRLEEGYGLNDEAIRHLASRGAKVIVSVDCGVTSIGPAETAREAGVDLIITDHHHPPERMEDLPRAYAVVHPRRPDSAYPFDGLCGAGVAYKLAWRLATLACGSQRVAASTRSLLVDLLTYAALGSIADVVPLVGENRVFARYGLARIRGVGTGGEHPLCFMGLRALIEAAGLSGENIDAVDVGFRLAPRLNAAGRMNHARDAVELFTTTDEKRAAELAAELTERNNQRRAVEVEIFEQAAEEAERRGMTSPGHRAIVLADERWHPGVVGIVCSRLVERYSRPAILMQRQGGECHGSGRSVDGFHLCEALKRCAGHLERFGGHEMAVGLRMQEGKLESFTQEFVSEANSGITVEQLAPMLRVDGAARVEELTCETVGQLQALAPFGRGNPDVRVVVRGVRIASEPRTMGANAKHLSFHIAPPGRRETRAAERWVRVVGWGWGERGVQVRTGQTADVVLEPKLSSWNGETNVEGELKDLRVVAPAG